MAVGLDSTELGWPPSLWQSVYEQAASQGYRLSAHAGALFHYFLTFLKRNTGIFRLFYR